MLKEVFKKRTIKGYDDWSKTYADEVIPKLEKRGYSYSILAKIIAENFNKDSINTILEVGTGAGIVGDKILPLLKGKDLIGVDISLKMLNLSREKKCYKVLYRMDAEKLLFEDSSFDALYTSFMLHNSYSVLQSIKEFERITKPNSTIVIVDLMGGNEAENYINGVEEIIHSLKNEKGALSNYKTCEELLEIIRETNLEVVNVKRLGVDTGYTHYMFVLKNNKKKIYCKECADKIKLLSMHDYNDNRIKCETCGKGYEKINGIIDCIGNDYE